MPYTTAPRVARKVLALLLIYGAVASAMAPEQPGQPLDWNAVVNDGKNWLFGLNGHQSNWQVAKNLFDRAAGQERDLAAQADAHYLLGGIYFKASEQTPEGYQHKQLKRDLAVCAHDHLTAAAAQTASPWAQQEATQALPVAHVQCARLHFVTGYNVNNSYSWQLANKAIEQSENLYARADALCLLGEIERNVKAYKKARSWFELVAIQEINIPAQARAQELVVDMYQRNEGHVTGDAEGRLREKEICTLTIANPETSSLAKGRARLHLKKLVEEDVENQTSSTRAR